LGINNNLRASRSACSFLLLLIISTTLSAQIFKVDKTQFLTVTSGLLAIDLSNNYLDDKFIDKPSAAELASLNKDDVPFFDHIAFQPYSKSLKDWSDYTAIAAIGIATYTTYDHDYWMDNLMVFSEIMLAQSAFAKWIKTFSGRYRPFVYDDDVSLSKKREYNSQHSFFSMHSSTTFAASTFAYYYYSQNFGKNIPTALLIYSPSVATAVLRVASANHFPSDVVAGAVVGSGISYLICKLHRSDAVIINLGYNNIGLSIRY
jgi:PAP2 superfamily